jgi:acetyl esterase/lipase
MTTRDYMMQAPLAGIRIPYGPAPEQFGDLRLPDGPGPHPIVVVVHGGWWRSVYNLEYSGHLAAAFAADGFASWNIEYRRVGSPNGGYPNLLHDVSAAVAKLVDIAPEYDLDLTRIVVTGHSAGGHLAGWLAAKQTHPELDVFGKTPPLIGTVPVAGALDLPRTSELRVADSMGIPVHDFLGGTPSDVPEIYALLDPAGLLPVGMPIIAVHGTDDANVPLELSRIYVERAKAAGDAATLAVLEGVDHFEPFNPATPAGAVVRAAVRDLLTRDRG